MQTLSVIIITKNEANNIVACLESVKWAHEIIILDSGSTDDTINLCKPYTNKIYQTDWPGYGAQKNRALSYATGDFVLSLDADEILSSQLQVEIKQLLKTSPPYNAYSLLRLSKYCRKFLHFGDWKNDRCTRLFRRGTAHFSDSFVHEALVIEGKQGHLNALLLHNSFQNIEQVLTKLNEYSSLGAKLCLQKNKSSSLTKAIVHGCWTFIRSYFLRFGFLDGREGFMMAVSNAEGCYYRYLKLLYLQENNKKLKRYDTADNL